MVFRNFPQTPIIVHNFLFQRRLSFFGFIASYSQFFHSAVNLLAAPNGVFSA